MTGSTDNAGCGLRLLFAGLLTVASEVVLIKADGWWNLIWTPLIFAAWAFATLIIAD